MATVEQMAALSTPFPTSNGAEYLLPPLNLVTRRKALDYIELAAETQAAGLSDREQADKLFDGLCNLLMAWLGRIQPGLTREQIEEDFDITDVPGLMAIIHGMKAEIEASIPPASSAPRTKTRKGK